MASCLFCDIVNNKIDKLLILEKKSGVFNI